MQSRISKLHDNCGALYVVIEHGKLSTPFWHKAHYGVEVIDNCSSSERESCLAMCGLVPFAFEARVQTKG